jgi:hypothetical protein
MSAGRMHGPFPLQVKNPADMPPAAAEVGGEKGPRASVTHEPEKDTAVSAKLVKEKGNEARMIYMQYGQPRDLRYAHKVHGGALAPAWDLIWTDDTTVSTDTNANIMETEIRRAITNAVVRDIEITTGSAAKQQETRAHGRRSRKKRKKQAQHVPLTAQKVQCFCVTFELLEQYSHSMCSCVFVLSVLRLCVCAIAAGAGTP